MVETSSIKLNSLEKAMQARWALVFVSSLVFVDAYMMMRHGIGILSVNVEWIKSNVDIIESAFVVGAFTLSFGVVIPSIGYVGKIFLGTLIDAAVKKLKLRTHHDTGSRLAGDQIDEVNFVHKDAFRQWAIKNSNSAAYRDYEAFIAEKREIAFSKYMCQAFIVLSLIAYFFSSETNPSLLEAINAGIADLPWYQEGALKFISVILMLLVFGMAFQDEGAYRDHIYLSNHQIPEALKRDTLDNP